MNWLDQDTWRFINTFAPWLSALGSLAAVVTSLYLAASNRRPTVAVKVSLDTGPDLNGENERRYVRVDATNAGYTDVNIVRFQWEVGMRPFIKRFNQARFDSVKSSSAIPIVMKPAETATFFIFMTRLITE